jgi:hypothetical protein
MIPPSQPKSRMTRLRLKIDRPNFLVTGGGWPLTLSGKWGLSNDPEKAEALPDKNVQKIGSLRIKFGRKGVQKHRTL